MAESITPDIRPWRTRRGAVLTLDQGTTNTKALVVDAVTGAILASASRPVAIAFPAPGWVEQDGVQLRDATFDAAREALAHVDEIDVQGVCISNQRESVVCWSKRTGEPLGPVLGWQDARTADWCQQLSAVTPGAADLVRQRTGLTLDPMYSAPKMRAALRRALDQGADVRDIALGTVDSWLLWALTGEHVTELGNASRTLLLDLQTCTWSSELTELFEVPSATLPHLRGSDAGFGTTRADGPLPAGLPVIAVLADSHAAMYQQGCIEPGTGKATYGTGSSVMAPTLEISGAPAGITTTLAWHVDGQATYAREGNIIASGSALDWMASTLGAPAGTSGGAFLTELARTVPDSAGVQFVPAFSGLGAPYWDRAATGVLVGVSAGTTRAHLAHAALQCVAQQVADVVEAIESDGKARIEALRADGGATQSALLIQIQADVLNRPVHVSDSPEASALGAAALARRTLGYPVHPAQARARYAPTNHDQRPARRAWRQAVARSRGHATSS